MLITLHAPNPLDEASTCISTVSTGLKHFNNGAFEMTVLISSKASVHLLPR